MQIIEMKIEDLVFDPANARKHNEKNIDAIKGSLTIFGQQKPVVITDKNMIIAGNGLVLAAKQLQWKTVKCVRTSLDGMNLVAYGLADNRTAELAEWDLDVLEKLTDELHRADFGLDKIGFEMDFLNDLFKDDPPANTVDDPEVPFSEEIGPLDHYMVVMFENSEQYEKYCKLFGVERVKSNISGSGHANFYRFGDGRILPVKKLEGKIKHD